MVVTAKEKNLERKTIEFDHEHFRNLLFVPDDKRPLKGEYVATAREALPDVKGLGRETGAERSFFTTRKEARKMSGPKNELPGGI